MGGKAVEKYQFAAQITEGVVNWSFGVQTDDGEKYELTLRDGEEVPVLHAILRKDSTVYFDPKSGTLRTGWNLPGKD